MCLRCSLRPTMPPMTRTFAAAFALSLVGGASAFAQDGGEASIQTGAAYSSLRGGLAFVALNAEDLLGSGLDFRLGYQAGEDGSALEANTAKTFGLGTTRLGQETYVRAAIDARSSNWTSRTYALESYGANITVGAQNPNGLRYSGRVFWQMDSLSDFGDEISPLVSATPLQDSRAVGVGVNLGYAKFTDRSPMATGFAINSGLAVATALGDREWASAELGLQYNAALPGGLVLAVKGDAGQIAGRNGDDVNIVDRAFIGNPMPRGFAFSGLGPRDFVEDATDTPLGGNRFVTSSVELRIATPNPAVTVGAFADAGALWDLDVVEGGASGTIDDSYFLRTSLGVSVYWDTPIGLIQVNMAKPLEKRPLDKQELISLNLNFQF